MSLVRPTLPDRAARILEKARSDREAAKAALAELSVDGQVALLCETPVARRAALLSLVAAPELVIPRIPEAELCFIVKAIGPSDAGWVMEHASNEQMVACIDLDAWSGSRFSPERFGEWWLAAADAGPETLVGWFHALDPETLILALHDRIDVALKPADATDREDWVPPAGSQTLEGNFYYRARHEGDDLAELTVLLKCLFEANYWDYFRVMHGPLQELPIETEEWALRWRRGRLEDQGFPPREEAAALFARIEPEDLDTLPDEKPVLDVGGFRLPVWAPRIPVAPDAEHALLAAAARLSEDERSAFLERLFSVANKVAVAYGLPLSDVESVPTAIEDAIVLASRGLEELSRAKGLSGDAVLRRVPLEHLFRVGASFHPDRARRVLAEIPDDDADEPGA
ncbi:MAG: hypothetical protein HKP30_15305 [Myxococcales bacterium]|nr:hypothetical protein [Myxococcales bacterium]